MDGDAPLARVSDDFLSYQYEVLGILEHMASPDVTEICINRPGELWIETRQGWQCLDVPSLTFERARQFCTAVVNESNTGQRITDTDPVVSLTFPTGQRAQFVIPPACDAGNGPNTSWMASSSRYSSRVPASPSTTASCWSCAANAITASSSARRCTTRRTWSCPVPPAAARPPS